MSVVNIIPEIANKNLGFYFYEKISLRKFSMDSVISDGPTTAKNFVKASVNINSQQGIIYCRKNGVDCSKVLTVIINLYTSKKSFFQ